jgi:FkbM family methyltransferase
MTGPTSTPESLKKRVKQLSGFAPAEIGPPEALPLDYDGAELFLYVTSRVEHRSRLFSCRKEPWTVQWLEEHVRPGDVVYDVGANVGAYSLIAAHKVGSIGTVVAFEPGYASYSHLCDNIVLNGFADRMVAVPLPLSSETNLGIFQYFKLTPGHARHTVVGARLDGADVREPIFRQRSLVIRLDDAVRWFGLPPPRHMKIDVDGWEERVLTGGSTLLAAPSLQTLLIEIEEVNTVAVTALLGRYGFELTDRMQRTRDEETVGWWTGIFKRVEVR